MSTKRNNTSQGGFTLVELAVVLLIIGLIVGGILRGQELITSAQLNSVQTDANQIRTAVNTFRDKYVALPGDFGSADTAIGDSVVSLASGQNGDGNGRIDGGSRTSSNNEEVNAWLHLGASGILTSVDAEALSGGSTALSADNGFTGSVGGFFTIGNGLPSSNFDDAGTNPDIWLVLGASGDGSSEGIVASSEAAQLDRKIDDGEPLTGTFRGDTGSGGTSCTTTSGGGGGSATANNTYDVDGGGDCALGLQL